MEPYEIEVRERDKNKGHSPAGITMTRAEWDRRYLLGLLDAERSEKERIFAEYQRIVALENEKAHALTELEFRITKQREEIDRLNATPAPLDEVECGASDTPMSVRVSRANPAMDIEAYLIGHGIEHGLAHGLADDSIAAHRSATPASLDMRIAAMHKAVCGEDTPDGRTPHGFRFDPQGSLSDCRYLASIAPAPLDIDGKP